MKTFYMALVALCLGSSAAHAQSAPAGASALQMEAPDTEVWVNMGGFSRHFHRDRGYNENNLGLGVEVRTSPELSFMAGAFDNSVDKTTVYALVNWQPWTVGPFKVGGTVGLMNGYPSLSKGGAFFAVVPMVSWEGRRYGVNVGVIPSVGKVDGAVIVQFKLRVN